MIYTGYFAKTKKYVEAGLTPVSVAGVTPQFFEGPKWKTFAPRKELFVMWKSGRIDNNTYMELYSFYLENAVNEEALRKIKALAQRRDIVLCCYEKSGDFCHRHALAKWLGDKLGIEIKEYEKC